MNLMLRFREWQHRNGKGLISYTPRTATGGYGAADTGWCPTHPECRGREYRRDPWNRRSSFADVRPRPHVDHVFAGDK